MAKWADYGISAVRYNSKRTHIDRVRVHVDKGGTIGSSFEMTRQEVISAIENGETFVTIIKGSDGNWKKGQPVFIVVINNTKYIKTVNNGKEEDNLENLPEF